MPTFSIAKNAAASDMDYIYERSHDLRNWTATGFFGANGTQRGGKVMVSTHSPDFLNAMELQEVFRLKKNHGYTQIHRAKDDVQIAKYMQDGDLMGYLWKERFFGGVSPRGSI